MKHIAFRLNPRGVMVRVQVTLPECEDWLAHGDRISFSVRGVMARDSNLISFSNFYLNFFQFHF
jgi:hypothetical protein